jgi:transposase
MTRPYSVDLRERVMRTVEPGLSRRTTARRFEVSVSFVIKLVQRWRRQGTVEPEPYGGWKRPALAAHAGHVRDLLVAEPDLTIAELRARLAAEGIDTSPAAISRFLTSENLTRKKRRRTRLSKNDPTSPRPGRQWWLMKNKGERQCLRQAYFSGVSW